jgi:hypothetical protein
MCENGVVTNAKDRDILRDLATQVREIADRPANLDKKRRWLAHNSLKPGLPMVLTGPEGSWGELLPWETMQCEDDFLKGWEYGLRMRILWTDFLKDDSVQEPYFNIGWICDEGDYGVVAPKTQGENRGSYVWDPPLKDLEKDLRMLKFRQPKVDKAETHRLFMLAEEILGDILTVRMRGLHWWTMGLTWPAADLLGLEELMFAMVDQPKALHRYMAWLRDEQEHFILWFEKNGYLSPNTSSDGIASGGIGYTEELGFPKPGQPAKLKHLWGFGESQETTGISPEMFAEFVLPYQLPLLERFGLNSYGCCEPVHTRWKHIKKVPRLRRVSVSPWCDQEFMAEALGRDVIFSRKPNPALVCVDFDEEVVRKDLRKTLEVAGDCVLEIVLKDTHTVQNKPERLQRWVEITREEIDRRYS